MGIIVKPGETAPLSGTYIEVGQGGGKVKNALRIFANQGDTLLKLKPYSIKIEHNGTIKSRNRQHCLKFVQK